MAAGNVNYQPARPTTTKPLTVNSTNCGVRARFNPAGAEVEASTADQGSADDKQRLSRHLPGGGGGCSGKRAANGRRLTDCVDASRGCKQQQRYDDPHRRNAAGEGQWSNRVASCLPACEEALRDAADSLAFHQCEPHQPDWMHCGAVSRHALGPRRHRPFETAAGCCLH
jgi:hypothetical protein